MLICIAGKNNIAVEVLKYLMDHYAGHEFCVICNRTECGKDGWQRSLRLFAEKHHIPEYRLEDVYYIQDMCFISLEFDRIVNPDKFATKKLYNIHFSYLPEYKGMYTSAIPILNGAAWSGVTFHKIDRGIDTGDIIAQTKIILSPRMTCRQLYLRYLDEGARLVIDNLDAVINDKVTAIPQPAENASYYSKAYIDYADIVIDLKQTAAGIIKQLDAFTFREYQLPVVHGYNIIDAEILRQRSEKKPGEIVERKQHSFVIATIDYDLELYEDRFGELLSACECGNIDVVKEICAIKRYLEEKDEHGWTPLIVATYHNQKKIVKYLMEAGADIHAVNNNGTNLLMYAANPYIKWGDSELLRLYYDRGLQLNRTDYREKNLYDYLSPEQKAEINRILKI